LTTNWIVIKPLAFYKIVVPYIVSQDWC